MSSSLALTAFSFKPSLSFSPPPLRSGRRMMAGVRSEMKVYKGTHMREQRLTEMIEQKVAEAKQVCGEDETSDECKVAWDEVEEVSQAKADLRLKIHQLQKDPLEHFCQENPETDECRVYED
ncbi:CP12 domain-containing protein 3 [Perilla frutescens var. hirtella]|uniref:CP12 domain-containing protein 3 n=1 Tax=Perilla frutescens var. hirtella TaxID=608512 RepID=A0AAD4JIX1_PERFH|nr:CP12 domain-containing protein 3 [Perilla frutescens var. frutescens]KAH6778282.1 CP12 domain-containing protein 3 [Perilla frutescens var. frutescens]KAH6786668.1 CP12 domain-containing protein 3 [Perilla frutescens var. hirtella]KAH6834703.1 CP12 domain-containing protein 3 [Perilla frutescens var. hirtella]